MPILPREGRVMNARESNPNEYIQWIAELPNKSRSDDARKLLNAVAAQVKPIMKKHGIRVTKFEEYDYNRVFAGRNWEAGEIIELVLRRPAPNTVAPNSVITNGIHTINLNPPDPSSAYNFFPMNWLLSVMTHELAHCHHMNHGPGFQALWSQLTKEVNELQARGYFGDGFYSDGQRLADSAPITRADVNNGVLPAYTCGGAQSRGGAGRVPDRSERGYGGGGGRRRRARGQGMVRGEASTRSGAQTAKRRKASRVNTKAFENKSGGNRLDGGEAVTGSTIAEIKSKVEAETKRLRATIAGMTIKVAKERAINKLTPQERSLYENTTHGKRAGAKSAAEARADAFEALLRKDKMKANPDQDEIDELADSDEEDYFDDDLEDDYLEYEAEFGPDAAERMIGGLLPSERDMMRSDGFFNTGRATPNWTPENSPARRTPALPAAAGDDSDEGLPPLNSLPLGRSASSETSKLAAAKKATRPAAFLLAQLGIPGSSSIAGGSSQATCSSTPGSAAGPSRQIAPSRKPSASGSRPSFGGKDLVTNEKDRAIKSSLGLGGSQAKNKLGSMLADSSYWHCAFCGSQWHEDYGRCGTADCDGVNPKRFGMGSSTSGGSSGNGDDDDGVITIPDDED